MFYGLHEHFPKQRCDYITLLRDPIERFLSNFEHARRHVHPLREMVTGHEGLERFCNEHAAKHYRDLFVRRLAGVWDEVTQLDLDRAGSGHNDSLSDLQFFHLGGPVPVASARAQNMGV